MPGLLAHLPAHLLAQHAPTARVAFGALGERTAADLLCDAAAVAQALPEAAPGARVLIGIRRDRYAFTAALLGAWARGHDVLLPAVDVSREAFLSLAQGPGVAAVLHDTLSSAALPIARILAEARPERALQLEQLVGDSVVHMFGRSGRLSAQPMALRRSQLLAEASDVGAGLQLPAGALYLPTSLPETRYGLTVGVLWPLLSGGAFVRDDPRAEGSARQLLEHVPRDASARVLVSVPAQLRALVRSQPGVLPRLSHVISASAPLPRVAWSAITAPSLRRFDLYFSERAGALGHRSDPDAELRALPSAAQSPAADGGVRRWSELEERVAWLEGVLDAALLPPETEQVAPHGACRLAVLAEAGLTEAALRSEIARAVPELSIAELMLVHPHTAPADPAGVASFSGGLRGLRRDGAGRHDRTGLQRLFGLSAEGAPLSRELGFGASNERDGKHVTEIAVPVDYVYFAGHFPGYPILPGAAQLSEMVLPCARRARPGLGRLVRMARLKFQERIMPGDHIQVVLTFPADPKQLDFSLLRSGSVCAAGRLSFEPASSREEGA